MSNTEKTTNSKTEKSKKQLAEFFKGFKQTISRQDKVYNQVKENTKADFDFYILTIFSAIIISLGILISSTAVVIGGMLIAPLVWPILAMSLGIALGRPGFLRESIFTLLKSIVLIVLISMMFGFITPDLVMENNEVATRTSPTLFEMFIGLAAGFIGAFIVAYPKMGSAIAGVVIAAPIVPPVAIIGISLSKGDLDSAFGAMLLFVSNLIAIIFSAVILFLISNFTTRSERGEDTSSSGFRWTLILLLIIIVPLFFITRETTSNIKNSRIIIDIVETSFESAVVSDIKINEKETLSNIALTIRYHENVTVDQVKVLEKLLTERLNKNVFLHLQIIPVIEAGNKLPGVFIN